MLRRVAPLHFAGRMVGQGGLELGYVGGVWLQRLSTHSRGSAPWLQHYEIPGGGRGVKNASGCGSAMLGRAHAAARFPIGHFYDPVVECGWHAWECCSSRIRWRKDPQLENPSMYALSYC
jgi:hypothetical protein